MEVDCLLTRRPNASLSCPKAPSIWLYLVTNFFVFSPSRKKQCLTPPSMALLSTGITTSIGAEKSSPNYHHQEKCCPQEDLEFEYDCPVELFCHGTLPSPSASKADHDTTVSLEEGLNLLDQVHCDVSLGGSCNGICSVPSPPLSDCSSDSGVLGSVQSAEETFLAGLFGSDFSILQTSQLDQYSPTPSPSDRSTFSASPHASQEPHLKSEKEPPRAVKSDTIVLDKNRKNAEAARQNRIKKKKYVEGLEKECSSLKTENVVLKTKCHEYQNRCQRLQSEVVYLKGVLANESVLGSLIQNIPNVPGIQLTSSFRKRANPSSRSGVSSNTNATNEEGGASKRVKLDSSAGICLHVSKNVVSLEFCENCSKQASTLL